MWRYPSAVAAVIRRRRPDYKCPFRQRRGADAADRGQGRRRRAGTTSKLTRHVRNNWWCRGPTCSRNRARWKSSGWREAWFERHLAAVTSGHFDMLNPRARFGSGAGVSGSGSSMREARPREVTEPMSLTTWVTAKLWLN